MTDAIATGAHRKVRAPLLTTAGQRAMCHRHIDHGGTRRKSAGMPIKDIETRLGKD